MITAVVWHWWIAPIMVISVVGLLLATAAGYVMKVVRPRYAPKQKK